MILVTGSRGNLGRAVCRKFTSLGIKVLGTRRLHQESTPGVDEAVLEDWTITLPQDVKITLIIHLANSYKTRFSQEDISDTMNSNVGMAVSVATLQQTSKAPVITLGSFFEKAPAVHQPWSYYSCSKIAARSILSDSAELANSKLIYIYIYDTYGGGTNRGKFIDILVDSIRDPKPFGASLGHQVQDLTHVSDVANGIVKTALSVAKYERAVNEFQMNSGEVFSLRELVDLAEEVCRVKIPVKWGELPYRKKEVFEMWDSAPLLPSWQPTETLQRFFQGVTLADDNEEPQL